MKVYPERLAETLRSLDHAAAIAAPNGSGRAVDLTCGTVVNFDIEIDEEAARVSKVGYRSNGCGYALAAAEVAARVIESVKLADLHGISDHELQAEITRSIGTVPGDRATCVETVIAGLKAAFAAHRAARAAEYIGDSPLICSCFGVSEDTIESFLSEPGAVETGSRPDAAGHPIRTVADVTSRTNAGAGCGSCHMLIEELIAAHAHR